MGNAFGKCSYLQIYKVMPGSEAEADRNLKSRHEWTTMSAEKEEGCEGDGGSNDMIHQPSFAHEAGSHKPKLRITRLLGSRVSPPFGHLPTLCRLSLELSNQTRARPMSRVTANAEDPVLTALARRLPWTRLCCSSPAG